MIYWRPVIPFKNMLPESVKKLLKTIYSHTKVWGLPKILTNQDILYLNEMKRKHPEYEKELNQLISVLNKYHKIEVIETR